MTLYSESEMQCSGADLSGNIKLNRIAKRVEAPSMEFCVIDAVFLWS